MPDQQSGDPRPIVAWTADHQDVPRQLDQGNPSSESTVPTLRNRSLDTVASPSPLRPEDLDESLSDQAAQLSEDLLAISGKQDIHTVDDTSAGHKYLAYIGANLSPVNQTTYDGHGFEALCESNFGDQSENVDIESSVNTTPSHSGAMEELLTTKCVAIVTPNRRKLFGARLDTGSSHNILFQDAMERLRVDHLFIPEDPGRTVEIRGLSGSVRVIGSLKLKFLCKGCKIKAEFKVVPPNGQIDAILGAFVVLEHELLPMPARQSS
jgi:hypothetical protein